MDVCSRFQLKKCSRGRHDRISSLPDDILFFILSFLTCKEVIKTSILSRRWLDLWLHTPVLNFLTPVSDVFHITDKKRRNYVKRVNRVLRRHKGHYLEEFKIVCDLDKRNRKDIDRWFVFALSRKVQRLELNLLLSGRYVHKLSDNYVFPGRFLNFSRGGRCPQFDLTCLKSLSLKSVDVTGEAINFILQDCPFLERLEVVGTDKLVDLVISDPTLALKYLQIIDCDHLEVLSISNFNLVSLDISSSIGDLTLTDVPMLVELSISASPVKISHSLSQAFDCHSQLEALTLGGHYLTDVTHISTLDQLTKLKRLVIGVVASWGDESLTELVSLINSCPPLEEFVLKLCWITPMRTSRAIHEVERLKSSSSSLKSKSLKVFEFQGYYGRVRDIELIMHVVENSFCLEKIIIDPRDILEISPYRSRSTREQEARSNALQHFETLKESIPQRIRVIVR